MEVDDVPTTTAFDEISDNVNEILTNEQYQQHQVDDKESTGTKSIHMDKSDQSEDEIPNMDGANDIINEVDQSSNIDEAISTSHDDDHENKTGGRYNLR